jgi:hypothetical protein
MMPKSVAMLEQDLREIFGARLQSVVQYGMRVQRAATDTHGGAHDAPALLHTLAIVDTITAADLRACARRVVSWHGAGVATPLLLAAHEFARSLDTFPLEFGAIVADHVVVAGRDPFTGLQVDPGDVRRACEVQARSHLLHLREGFLETAGRGNALAVLIVDSAPAFAALLESIARLEGAGGDAAAVSRHAQRRLDVAGGIVSDVLRLASVTEIPAAEAERIYPAYLEAVERLVQFVDGWHAR